MWADCGALARPPMGCLTVLHIIGGDDLDPYWAAARVPTALKNLRHLN